MYGYVSINRQTLSREEYARFRAVYCGLCRTLSKRFGQCSRLILSYDMTVLQLLLGALYDEEETHGRERCPERLIRPHEYVAGPCAEYAADMSVILAYYKLMDDRIDEPGRRAPLTARTLEAAFAQVKARYPEKCAAIDAFFQESRRLETEDPENIDALANCTGSIITEIYLWRDDFFSPLLAQMGRALGRFIYLCDAYEDLDSDIKHNRPNPLRTLRRHGDYEQEMRQILTMEMDACTSAFERLPIVQDASLLRNVFYSGVWGRYSWLCKKRHVPLDDAPGNEKSSDVSNT